MTLGESKMKTEVTGSSERITMTCSLENPDSWPLIVQKVISVQSRNAEVGVVYRLRWTGADALTARWAVQWNLALTAGDAPGRYLRLSNQPSLGSRGEVEGRLTLSLVDEWVGTEVALKWGRAARVSWAPVETVSLSEAGFERIYQGAAILLCWPLDLTPGEEWEETITLNVLELSQNTE